MVCDVVLYCAMLCVVVLRCDLLYGVVSLLSRRVLVCVLLLYVYVSLVCCVILHYCVLYLYDNVRVLC